MILFEINETKQMKRTITRLNLLATYPKCCCIKIWITKQFIWWGKYKIVIRHLRKGKPLPSGRKTEVFDDWNSRHTLKSIFEIRKHLLEKSK